MTIEQRPGPGPCDHSDLFTMPARAVLPTEDDKIFQRMAKACTNLSSSLTRTHFEGRHRLTHEVLNAVATSPDIEEATQQIGSFALNVQKADLDIADHEGRLTAVSFADIVTHNNLAPHTAVIADLVNSELDPEWVADNLLEGSQYIHAHAVALLAARSFAYEFSSRANVQDVNLRELSQFERSGFTWPHA